MTKRILLVGLIALLLGIGILVSAQLFDSGRTKGDVNNDGDVNVLDCVRVVNIILEIPRHPMMMNYGKATAMAMGTLT